MEITELTTGAVLFKGDVSQQQQVDGSFSMALGGKYRVVMDKADLKQMLAAWFSDNVKYHLVDIASGTVEATLDSVPDLSAYIKQRVSGAASRYEIFKGQRLDKRAFFGG